MTAVATKQGNAKHSSSYRFRPRISHDINHFSEVYKRKKTSIVEEALEQYFERERKKQEEIFELKKLLKAGDESGEPMNLPTVEEIVAMAKKKYNH